MTYEEAIQELSRTIYDVAFYENRLTILESTPDGQLERQFEMFYGTYEEAVIKGTETIQAGIPDRPKKNSTKNSRKRKRRV